jgi:N-acetyl-anhydromuramyl-L-alanine amidase AmpD
MQVIDQFMEKGEYYTDVFEKNTIYLHHTAGGHRPDWVIKSWDTDDVVDEKVGKKNVRVVATAYVIGNKSTRNTEQQFDGAVYRAFDEKLWAHHLGTTFANNKKLNQQSIGIEVCNYGPLKKGADGKFYTYVNSVVPDDQVCELDKIFKGYKHYHLYTDKQIQALKDLILALKAKYPKIEMRTPLLTVEGFELNDNAKKGVAGIYNHTNVRADKFDMSPQPKLIKMLKEICT